MFEDLNVLVIGDICLDIIEEGPSYRQSPEAPVPVILNPTQSYTLGMMGNVISNLIGLGAQPNSGIVYGTDIHGQIVQKLYEEMHNSSIYKTNVFDGNTEITTVKKRILANEKQVARIDFESSVDKTDIDNVINDIKRRIKEAEFYDLIIISDYNKGVITKESWSIMRPLLEQLSDNFFVDTKKKNVLDFYEGMYIFPNKKEMEEIMAFNNCSTRNQLRKEMDLDFIVETASEDGAFIYTEDKIFHCQAFESNVVDVTGCGDTFLAAFALYYTKYKKKRKALEFANYCCSKVIERKGTSPININEVLGFERNRNNY